jgi:large subunit ribosomal protein L17
MRHGNKVNNLGRKAAHRKAMLSNMACSLIEHKRITTTVAKAKALRVYLEPLLTKSKNDTTHSRRTVFSYLQNKHAISELYREIAPKIANRDGGYTRIIRTGYRLGDNAEMCLIELVDFNELYTKDAAKKTTRRSRRGGTGSRKEQVESAADSTETIADAEVISDDSTEEAPVAVAEKSEDSTVPETDANASEASEPTEISSDESKETEDNNTEESESK